MIGHVQIFVLEQIQVVDVIPVQTAIHRAREPEGLETDA